MESGSFATIYLGEDTYVSESGEAKDGIGEPRLISDEHLRMIQEVAKVSPEIEYVRGDAEDFTAEKKKALEVLA